MKSLLACLLGVMPLTSVVANEKSASQVIMSTDFSAEYLQAGVALLVIIGLIVVLYLVLTRMKAFSGKGRGNIKVMSYCSLGNKEKVVMLQAGNKQLLVGVTPNQINCLHTFDKGDLPEDFGQKLSKEMKTK